MKRSFVLGIFLGVGITALAFAVSSEISASMDPVKVSPQYYKVLLENEQLRVLEYRLKPGEKEQMHSHSAGIVYSFSDGRLATTLQDGSRMEAEAKTGIVRWRDPVTHSLENTGNTEIHALAVELKKTCE